MFKENWLHVRILLTILGSIVNMIDGDRYDQLMIVTTINFENERDII